MKDVRSLGLEEGAPGVGRRETCGSRVHTEWWPEANGGCKGVTAPWHWTPRKASWRVVWAPGQPGDEAGETQQEPGKITAVQGRHCLPLAGPRLVFLCTFQSPWLSAERLVGAF